VQGRDSRDMCRIVQAREMAKFARMDLERRRPALYGMKTGLAIDQQITVTVNRNAKKDVRASKRLRTPSGGKSAVDITPGLRRGPTGSATRDDVKPLENGDVKTDTHVEQANGTTP
jgi:hypothetical protein